MSNPGRGPFHNFWSWTAKWKIYIDIFYGVSCNIKHITAISSHAFSIGKKYIDIFKWLIGKGITANLHASLDSTYKVEFQKVPPDVISWEGSIPQVLLLNYEIKD